MVEGGKCHPWYLARKSMRDVVEVSAPTRAIQGWNGRVLPDFVRRPQSSASRSHGHLATRITIDFQIAPAQRFSKYTVRTPHDLQLAHTSCG